MIILRAIADALDVPINELLPRAGGRSAAMNAVLDVLGRMPLSELPAVAELIEKHAAVTSRADRARRIALVGLRGAGKSTLGRLLAASWTCRSSSSTAWLSGLRRQYPGSDRDGRARDLPRGSSAPASNA